MIGSNVVISVLFIWFFLLCWGLVIGLFGLFDNEGICDCVFLSVDSIMFDVNDGVVVFVNVLIFWVLWL